MDPRNVRRGNNGEFFVRMPTGSTEKKGSGKTLTFVQKPYLGNPDVLVEVEAGNDLMTDEFQDLQSNVNNFFKNVSKESFFDDADTTQSTNPENSQIQPQNAPIEHVTPQIDIRDSLELQVQNDYPNVPSYSPANPQFISLGSGAEFGATTPSLPESEGNTWSVLDISVSGDSLHGIQAQRRLRAVDTPSTVFSYFIRFSLNFYVFCHFIEKLFFYSGSRRAFEL